MQQIGLDAVLNNVPDFTGGIDKMNAAVDSFAQNGKQAGDGFGAGFGEIVTGALRHIGELAVDALGNAARAVAGFVKDSIGIAGDFQANMLEFQSVAGKDVDTKGLEQFRDLFIDIGKRLPVSTSEVQQAAIEMVKGGIDPATIAAGGLEQNIKFAAAAMDGDLVKAAEISSKILGGWTAANATAAERAAFLTHSTDLLAKAANASSTDVEGLSRGIFQAQGIAKTAGVSFDDLTTTLAELAPRFGSSAEAGTSLKNLIVRLQPTTDPAINAMKQLGLYTEKSGSAFYDAQGNFVGFQQASQLLQNSLKGLTKEQQAAALQTIFGNDAMSSASALAELGAAGYTKMADALANANGVQDAAALKQQGFNTALDNAKGSVEALQITIGTYLLPVLTDLLNNTIAPAVNTITDFSSALFGSDEAFNRLSPTMQSFATILENLGGYFSAVVDDGDYLNDFLADLPGPIQGVVGGVGLLIAAFGPLQEYIGAVVDDGDTLNDFLTDIPKPMRDVVQAVGEIVSWFGKAGTESNDLGGVIDDLSGIWTKALGVVQDVGQGYMAIAQSILPIVTRFWSEHGEQITNFLQTAYTKIIAIVNTALDLYDAVVPKVLSTVAAWISNHAASIQVVLGGAWDAISGIIDGALTLIEGMLSIALDLIRGNWSKAWDDLKSMSASFVLDLQKTIEGFLNIIAGLFGSSLHEIQKTWTDNWHMLVEIATSIDWANIGYLVVAGIIGGIDDNADRLMNTLKNLAASALQAAKDALGISSPSKAFMAIGQFTIEGIIVGIEGALPGLNSLADQVALTLTEHVKHMTDSVAAAIAKTVQDIKDQVQAAQDAIADLQIDSLHATANIDRQKIKNLKDLADISQQQQAGVTEMLEAAQQQAAQMTDPAQAAEFFRQRSAQIFELAKLNDQILEATAAGDTARRNALIEQYQLVNAAQNAETQALLQQQQQGSATQDIIAQLQALLSNQNLPGILDSPLINALNTLLGQLRSPPSLAPPTTGGATTNYSNATTLNMPVYTNMSPTAIQSSMAIAQAALV